MFIYIEVPYKQIKTNFTIAQIDNKCKNILKLKKKPLYDVLFTKAFALFVLVQSCFL